MLHSRRRALVAACAGTAILLWLWPPGPGSATDISVTANDNTPTKSTAARSEPLVPDSPLAPRWQDVAGGSDTAACDIPEPEPTLEVVCPLHEPIPHGLRGTVHIPRAGGSVFALAVVGDGDVSFSAPLVSEGWGSLSLPGQSDVELVFDASGCTLREPVARAAVSGWVRTEGDAQGAMLTVQGCGVYGMVDPDGSFFVEPDAGECALWAVRQDGSASIRGEPLWLDLAPNGEQVVELWLPPWPAAGVGLAFDFSDGEPAVATVEPGSPADEAGLRPCDVLLEVDGEAVGGASSWELIDRLHGPPDTSVSVLVLGADEAQPFSVELARQPEAAP